MITDFIFRFLHCDKYQVEDFNKMKINAQCRYAEDSRIGLSTTFEKGSSGEG